MAEDSVSLRPGDDSPMGSTEQDDGRAQHSRPPEIQPYSGVLDTKGKVVIRPIAFKPTPNAPSMSPSSRFGYSSERYGSTPILTRPGSRLTLYGSTSDLHHQQRITHSHINYSLDRKLRSSCPSANSSSPLAMSSLTSLPHTHSLVNYDSLESVRKSPINKVPYHSSDSIGGSLLDLTPSPSDSGVSELEAALRDRDSELAYLRQTMEHNEQVIFRVYQEKEKVWERELRRLKMIHESRLRASAQKALKLEQMLMMQTYQLNQDKKRLIGEMQRGGNENEKLRQELATLKSRLEETEWGLCQKTGEISLLKSQLKEAQNENTNKCQELLQLKTDFRDLQSNLEHCEKDCDTLKARNDEKDVEIDQLKEQIKKLTENKQYASNDSINKNPEDITETERLRAEIRELREELSDMSLNDYSDVQPGRVLRAQNSQSSLNNYEDTLEDIEIQKLIENNNIYNGSELDKLRKELQIKTQQFDHERLTWAHEKEKVLRYQKQLQMNYVQMYRRTKNLETQIQKLTNEIEVDRKKYELAQTIEL